MFSMGKPIKSVLGLERRMRFASHPHTRSNDLLGFRMAVFSARYQVFPAQEAAQDDVFQR